MPDLLTLLQLGLSAVLIGVIVERVYNLMIVAPLSRRGVEFVLRSLERAELEPLRVFARGSSGAHVSRILSTALEPARDGERHEDLLSELSFELSGEAAAGLRALRVGATIASTLGLLIGIVRLRGGFTKPPGLLALEAGLTERLAVSDALFSMAIGVGTSAVCFYALSLLREAARSLIAQRGRVENALLARLPTAPRTSPPGQPAQAITH